MHLAPDGETIRTELQAWFAGYCRTYHSPVPEDDRNIRLKEDHTERVCDNMRLIARSLPLSGRDLLLAELVALLHDVGRFEQYRRFRTFKDSDSVNHAALGARVLEEKKVLALLPREEQELILRAVTLHNVFRLPVLDDRTALFVKLIRDADKLDIWRVFVEYYDQPEGERASAVGLGFPDPPRCSTEVLQVVRDGKMVDLSTLETLNDFKLLQLSWVYDLNFPETCRLLQERGLFRRLAASLPQTEEVYDVCSRIDQFLDRRCDSAFGQGDP